MSGELGKASLDLEANLGTFDRNMESAHGSATRVEDALDAVAKVARVAEIELNKVKMDAGQGARSREVADRIESSVGSVGRAAMEASRHLERVKLDSSNAAETTAAGDVIDRKLNAVTRNANEARRALDRLRLAGVNIGGVGDGGRGSRNPGSGVGPFGSGFGRIGLLGAGIGAGALTGPAAAPAAVGVLASIPTLAAGGAGVLGTLALAFAGVGKAIGGDLKAFKELEPAQRQFVLTVRSLDGALDKLKQTAGANLFPGLTKALHAALSPETLGAVTAAVAQFGRAIGQAGLAWGKYFGGAEFQSIFGPLMAAGARNLTVLSDAVLKLFDALGVLARSAIPFTSLLTLAADKGAKLVDSWIHAKDASGGLSRAMNEAESSLRLVGGLLVSIGRAVVALGRALYPVSKIAVKELTAGFNGLAEIIQRNQKGITEFVTGALQAVVATVRVAVPLVEDLAKALHAVANAIGGWKVAFELVISGFLAYKFIRLGLAVAGVVTKIGKIGRASTVAEAEVGGLRAALLGLAAPAVLGALATVAAALVPVVSFVQNPNKKTFDTNAGTVYLSGDGKWRLRRTGSRAKPEVISAAEAAKLTGKSVADMTGVTSGAVNPEAAAKAAQGAGQVPPPFHEPGIATPYLTYLLSKAEGTKTTADDQQVLDRIVATLRARLRVARSLEAKNALQDAINSDLAQLDALSSSPFGTPPPFTKNLGPKGRTSRPPLIPPLASRAEALASANASKASVLGNVGGTAKRYLNAELADLGTADKAIRAKYEHSTGKIHTELFAALTRVENKMRTVRKQIAAALKKDRLEELQFAVDQAKLAVEQAQKGTAAYDRAVKAEEKSLRAEIVYLDKRRRNTSLSLKERKRALVDELTAERELKALLKPGLTAAAGANEAQFLSSFRGIVQAYAPNAFPQKGSGKTDTHLYELVHETRQSNEHLKDIKQQTSFPASGYAVATAEAATG